MVRWLLQSTLCLILCPLVAAQQVVFSATNSSTRKVQIPMDTLVMLRLEHKISTANAKKDDRIRFTLDNDLSAGGRVMIPAGTSCYLTITKVWRATPQDPNLIGGIQFSDPKIDLGPGQAIRLTKNSYAARHADDGLVDPIWFLLVPLAPLYWPVALVQEIRYKRDAIKVGRTTLKQNMNWKPLDTEYQEGQLFKYYVQRNTEIRMDRLAISNVSVQVP
jgi:hypothetical protein